MVFTQNIIFGVGLNPIDSNGATTNGTAFDLAAQTGISYASAVVQVGNLAIAITTLKVQTSDDNSTWVDLTGAAFTAPTASDDNKIYTCHIKCNGNPLVRRYLRVTVTGGAAATLISSVWLGSRAVQGPSSATEAGVAEQLFV